MLVEFTGMGIQGDSQNIPVDSSQWIDVLSGHKMD